jgi:transcriptional regulator with XRE-family HTH domain
MSTLYEKRLIMIDSRYVRSLIYLNEKTITSLALEAGVDPTNLSRFLKGHSTVSDEKMGKVLEHLGVDPVTGTLKPVVYRWKVNPATFNLIEFEKLLSDLVPGGGKIIMLALKRDDHKWSAIVGKNGTRIIMDHALAVLEDLVLESFKVRSVEEFVPEWTGSFRKISPSDLKKLIEDKTLTPSEFDEILGLNHEPSTLDGASFAREDGTENEHEWTWNLILRKAREAGLNPEEAAKRLGLSK